MAYVLLCLAYFTPGPSLLQRVSEFSQPLFQAQSLRLSALLSRISSVPFHGPCGEVA